MKNIFRVFFLISGMAMLGACSPHHENAETELASTASVSAESIEAFSATVYAFGQTQGCASCHSDRVNTRWMSPDPATAYAFAKPLVDFENPTVSVFASYAGNNHCNSPICNVAGNVVVMQSLLSQWAQVEIQQGNRNTSIVGSGTTLANPPFVTGTLPIPNPLPLITSGTTAVLRFDLSQMQPNNPALNGVILELSIQSYNLLQSEYKVFNPRLIGNTSPVLIKGIHAYVRPASGSGLGNEDVNQGALWSGLSVMAGVFAGLPVSPLTTTSLGTQSNSEADVLTIGFATIQ